MKLIHLIVDGKVFGRTEINFAKLKGVECKYVVLDERDKPVFKHINDINLWRTVGSGYLNSTEIEEDMRWADALVVHWLQPLSAKIALRAPPGMAVVWSGWGGDYYHMLPGGERALVSEQTAKLLHSEENDNGARFYGVRRFLKRLTIKRIMQSAKYRLIQKGSNERVVSKFISRVDYFSAPIPDDYALLKEALGKSFRAEYTQISYGNIDQITGQWNLKLSGNDILLGNSASPFNNHAEMLLMLSKLDIGNRKVIVPLSYGDVNYANRIVEMGNNLLGSNFYPVRDFMPLDEYNKMLSQCAVSIMNHRRQQALGNAIIMLHLGAKVFLDSDGVVYKFFKNRGMNVFPICEIEKSGEASFTALTEEEKLENRNVLESLWGEKVVDQNHIRFIEKLMEHMSANA